MKLTKHEECPLLGLTDDLILDILFRLPVKSLGTLKCVNKKFDILISNPKFVTSHLDNSVFTPLTIAMLKYNDIASLELSSEDDITEGVKLKSWGWQFDVYSLFEERYFFIIGSCDGLLCIYIKEMKKHREDSLYLWNPVTNESNEISLPVGGRSTYVHTDSCWFGLVYSSNDYKILLVSTVYKPYCEQYMYLYSLKSDRWRAIYVDNETLSSISGSHSVFTEDALHYLIHPKCILKFSLVSGSFERIPFSVEPELFPNVDQTMLGVFGNNDCLCIMYVHYSEKEVGAGFGEDNDEVSGEESEEESEEQSKVEEDSEEQSKVEEDVKEEEWIFELWMLEEYNNWDSWIKVYRIDLEKVIAGLCTRF